MAEIILNPLSTGLERSPHLKLLVIQVRPRTADRGLVPKTFSRSNKPNSSKLVAYGVHYM